MKYKVNTKLICIKTCVQQYTKGKIYTIKKVHTDGKFYDIPDDLNNKGAGCVEEYMDKYFIKYNNRKEKLERILNH
jgi:hypothetical protein